MKIYVKRAKCHKSVLVNIEALSDLLSPNGLLTNSINAASRSSLSSPLHETQVCSVLRTLRWITEAKNYFNIRMLLIKEPTELSAIEVVCGFKQLEEIIYQRTKAKRIDFISSTFRWFFNEYGGEVLDGRTVSQCGFRSRFKDGGRFLGDISPLSITSSTPFVFKTIRTTKGRQEIIYFSIDRDWLDGLVEPGSIIETCLLNAQVESYKNPEEYGTISSIRTMLELISNSTHTNHIRSLLSKNAHLISETDAQKGLIQLEDLVQKNNTGIQKASRLRTFLNKWGGSLSNGKTIIDSGFKSRFVNQGKTLACIEPVFISVKKSVQGIISTETHCINTYNFVSLLPPKSLMASALINAEKWSKKDPIELRCLESLEQLLLILSRKWTWKIKRLLVTEPCKISTDYIYQGFIALENIIQNNFESDVQFFHSKNFRKFLNDYSGVLPVQKTIQQCKFKTRFSATKKSTIPLVFKTKSKKNGVYSYYEKTLNLTEINSLYTYDGLLGKSLNMAAQSSLSEPIFASMINSIWKMLKSIEKKGNLEIRTLLITPPSQITRGLLIKGFQGLEDLIEKRKLNGKENISLLLRSFLSQRANKLSNNLTIRQCQFKSRFKRSVPEKQLIAPLDKNGDVKRSLILTSHQSLVELRKQISDYYEEAIQQILDACSEEMGRYKQLCNEVSPLIKTELNSDYITESIYEIPKEVSYYTDYFCSNNRDATFAKTKDFIDEYGVSTILASALQKRLKTPLTSHFQFPGQSFCIPPYVKTWFPKSGRTNDFIWSGTLLPRQILLVCFIRIVIFTTWNKDVVATLTPDDLPTELPDSPFIIQGNKNKVDKLTPEVTVYPHDHDIREVINYLIFHVRNMRNLGLNPQTVWETIHSVRLTFLSGKFIEQFCERSSHPTPYFTLEQLAKQQINLRYKIDSNLEKSRKERNHSKVKTTAGYMATPLARIEYEANNAEFQRRLETTVQFLHAGEKSLISYNMDPRNIDHKLLASPDSDDEENTTSLPRFLLGDGSSCANIWAPVDKHHLDQDICRGRKCHKDGGCVYNEIILSPYEFSFSLRKRQWFIPRCELLLDKYGREYFDTYIAPEMIFVLGLTRYVEKANPALHREAVKLLTQEQETKL
ncbi:MAG: hypothetical protein WBF78_06505 [Vibrio anguillarum]